jgi:prolyl oligopeptidase
MVRHLLAFTLALSLAQAALAEDPPVARRVDTIDHDFGLNVPDPYRWMEGENNAEFNTWLKAQGAASRVKLDALPTLEAWRTRLLAAAGAGTNHGGHRLVGDRLFFTRSPAGKERILMVREADGREHVLLDPNLAPGTSIHNYSVSPDGSKVTVNLGHGGSEIGEVALFDVASGKLLPDTLKPVWSEHNPNWLPDGSGFFYTRMREQKAADPDPLQGMGAYLHILGKAQATDQLIAQAGAKDPLQIVANDFPKVTIDPGSDWAMLTISGARQSSRSCVKRLSEMVKAKAHWRCLVEDADNVQDTALMGNTLYLLSARDAPNRRVLALDLGDPKAAISRAAVVIPERSGVVLTKLSAARDGLYIKSMHQGLDTVERMDDDNHGLHTISMPSSGTIYLLRTDSRQDGALLSLQSWTLPNTTYSYSPDTDSLTDLHLGSIGAPSYPDIVAEEIEATSKDGTKVPLSVVRRTGLRMDGSAHAIVEGYGGYGISTQPFFDPDVLEWSKAGNIYAICHVRGGGENGDTWRTGGTGSNKQRGIEDFVACAQELAKRAYTTPKLTAGFGGSMGGILTGGAFTTAPEAWGAMVVQSGFLNPTRLLASKNGANQIAEVGDPRTALGMRQLLAMDPYQHVRNGEKYPPTAADHRCRRSARGALGKWQVRCAGYGRIPEWNSLVSYRR